MKLKDTPLLIRMNIRILRLLSLLFSEHRVRRFLILLNTTFLLFTEFNYMFFTDEGIGAIIRNSYMLVLWVNTLIRAYLLVWDHRKYEKLIGDLISYYRELQDSPDPYIRRLISDVDRSGDRLAKGNLSLGIMTCIGFALYPLVSAERDLPFGSLIPGVDELKSPFFEFWYVYELILTPTGCCMYIPYTSLMVELIMFGIVMCKTLQHRLRTLHLQVDVRRRVIECIQYQNRIIDYIAQINELIAFIFLFEFLAFGALLCALLFLLIIVESTAQIIIVCAYINMIFAQVLGLYWFANELREQSLAIATAAYETNWFTFPVPVQKQMLLLIMRAQRPTSILLGNVYPITLQLFQSLLNVSYSYFTLLKRVYS